MPATVVASSTPARSQGARPASTSTRRTDLAAQLVLVVLTLAVGLGLGWRSVERHNALQTNAEDLGFTDQIIWNFLRGQMFRFTTYQHAEFSTDIDLKGIRRPDSLLAYHVEPVLVLFAPIYAVVPDVRAILWLQGLGLALGAIPAYRLARRRLGHPLAGLAFALLYLLSPIGQWAALADFHTVALAAPLLMLALDALDAGQPVRFLVACLLAAGTKEEVGLIVAGLGVLGLLRYPPPRLARVGWLQALGLGPATAAPPKGQRAMCLAALAAVIGGAGWSILCVAVIIPHYSGGAISPFTARYADLGGSPGAMLRTLVQQPSLYLETLGRSEVLAYLGTLALAGGWLALLAPELLLPIAPILALNVLSSSPWMASGRAHYSASILPLVVAAAIVGAGRLVALRERKAGKTGGRPAGKTGGRPAGKTGGRPAGKTGGRRVLLGVALATVLLAAVAYRQDGIGPLVAGLPAPTVSEHALLARQLAASIPASATVSASTALYPHISQRAGAYLFPTLHDADYVFVDISGSPYPGEPGGTHQRLTELISGAEYRVLAAQDGLLLLARSDQGTVGAQALPANFLEFARVVGRVGDGTIAPAGTDAGPVASFHDGAIDLVTARLVPDGEVGPQGPQATLETVWRVRRPVPERPRPTITVSFRDGRQQTFENQPVLWWYPPEQWQADELIAIDVPGLAAREVTGWEASAPLDPPAAR